MNELETKILNAYKAKAEFYNMFIENDEYCRYTRICMYGMEEMVKVICGYVLHAHHENDCVGLPFDYVSIAKDGKILAQVNI